MVFYPGKKQAYDAARRKAVRAVEEARREESVDHGMAQLLQLQMVGKSAGFFTFDGPDDSGRQFRAPPLTRQQRRAPGGDGGAIAQTPSQPRPQHRQPTTAAEPQTRWGSPPPVPEPGPASQLVQQMHVPQAGWGSPPPVPEPRADASQRAQQMHALRARLLMLQQMTAQQPSGVCSIPSGPTGGAAGPPLAAGMVQYNPQAGQLPLGISYDPQARQLQPGMRRYDSQASQLPLGMGWAGYDQADQFPPSQQPSQWG